ncbi:MAG: hypothetical protein FWH17_02790 [Oscillospiraceae bacterium]|nr:hypothetical protein [Oscillospiraceae bacterium]
MNYFEQELRRLTQACDGVINPTFAGRACYGDLGGDNRIKLEFVTQGTHERYEAVKATVLNRVDGEVDSLFFRFGDVWGKKHPHGSAHGTAHIWTYQGKSEWYAYYPTDADMKKLGAEVGAYLAVFTDRALIPEQARGQTGAKESVIKTIRESKQNQTPRKNSQARKKSELDL